MGKLRCKAPVNGMYTLMLQLIMTTLVTSEISERTGDRPQISASDGAATEYDTTGDKSTTLFWLFNTTNSTPRPSQQSGGGGNSFPTSTGLNGGIDSIPSSVNGSGIDSSPSSTSGNGREPFSSTVDTNKDSSGSQTPLTFPSGDASKNPSLPGSNVGTIGEGRSLQIPGFEDEGYGNALGKPLRRIKCVGIGVFYNSPSKDRWCLNNCLNIPSFCPPMFCNCQYVD